MEVINVEDILGLAVLISTLLYMQNKVSFEPGISFLDALVILLCFGLGYMYCELIVLVFHTTFIFGFVFPFASCTSIYWYYKISYSLFK